MKKLFAILCLLSSPCFADEAPSTETLQALINSLQIQRNNASDQAAALAAQLEIAQKKISSDQHEISDLKAKLPKPDAVPTKQEPAK